MKNPLPSTFGGICRNILTKYFPQDTVLSVHPEPGAILQTKVVIVIQNNLQLQSESPAAPGGHSKIFL